MKDPLVSVIITCYNHGAYLEKAIDSVIAQSYQQFQIIIVDDGSTDNTAQICRQFPQVKYIFQNNSGLAAARNTGATAADGEFLLFLDADDWLLPEAIQINLTKLRARKDAAFVSGAYQNFQEDTCRFSTIRREITKQHYRRLLEINYIGMHATVMYRDWVFKKFAFNLALRYCEDYDLYLRITRQFSVVHHTELIAVYRKHSNNMSANHSAMLHSSLVVLGFQFPYLRNWLEKRAYRKGIKNWKTYYAYQMHDRLLLQIMSGQEKFKESELTELQALNPSLHNSLKAKLNSGTSRGIVKQLLQKFKQKFL